ncbi:MAG: sigma-70 family RNA polymerase sigma factor [Acidobacteria bacterium]|nr:sigma-70 family RNA polymerase sigma factor [Acidobacteriota bacterium]
MPDSDGAPVPELVEHLFRRQAGQMISTLTRILGARNMDLAEEVVQEALLKALQLWPFRGVPENPAAWLIQVAKNRALDHLRRHSTLASKTAELQKEFAPPLDHHPRPAGALADDELAMMFMCCHPAIPRESRVALTLKTVGGFGVREIARAFLSLEPAVAQRLVRAKRLIRDANLPIEMPQPGELPGRIESVLETIYLLFNEGYSALEGEWLVRDDLCEEAVRLASLVANHPYTGTPKAHALLALLLLQSARLPARTSSRGDLLLLRDQDRTLWDRDLIFEGLRRLASSEAGGEISEYHLQAGIAAAHALAASYAETDWEQILSLYDRLMEINPSPVVALNRAVALSQLRGPEAGIHAIEEIVDHPALQRYPLLPATLAELWEELGDREKAASYYAAALSFPCTEPVRRFLDGRLAALGPCNSR